jgi:lipopolysaccharide transport system permease protein
MFASPIGYPASLVPAPWRVLYALNPMTCVIEGFRAALFGTASVSLEMLAVSAMVAAGLLTTGILYFNCVERNIGDVV